MELIKSKISLDKSWKFTPQVLILIILGVIVVLGISILVWPEKEVTPEEALPEIIYEPRPGSISPLELQPIERLAITGEVTEVDTAKNLLKVKDELDQKVYTVLVSESTKITRENEKLKLTDLKVGDLVSAVAEKNITQEEFNANFVIILPHLIPLGAE